MGSTGGKGADERHLRKGTLEDSEQGVAQGYAHLTAPQPLRRVGEFRDLAC